MSIRLKFALIIVAAAAGLLSVAGAWVVSQKSILLTERQQKAKALLEVPYSVIAENYRQETLGKLSRADAQKRALESIQVMRYDQNNYFWVNDLHPTMIMHPMNPSLNGKDLTDYKDPTGKTLFVEMAQTVKNQGAGFVFYRWPKPGSDKPVPKISYVKGFDAWGWVLGTGIYVDDIDEAWRVSASRAAAIALTCLVVLLVSSGLLARSIFSRIANITARMKDMAEGEGDLTQRIEVSLQDELGNLAKWFNDFMIKMQATMSRVAATTTQLASASEKISASTAEQSAGAKVQNDQTIQVATAMEEMSATVSQISENSVKASDAARKASATAGDGSRTVDQALASMREIAQSVGDTAAKVEALGARSEQIGRVVGVIDAIAEQTNLLALNAAIEAARAGEQGRGFAVVADEVKKLAQRTARATKEVAEMIHSIQSETRNTVDAMQLGTRQVEAGVLTTTKAGESLQQIMQSAERVGDMITQIAAAATEQSAATQQVNSSLDQIAKVARETAHGSGETATACQDLSKMAQELKALLAGFKLDEATRTRQKSTAVSQTNKKIPATPTRHSPNPEPELEMSPATRER